MKPSTSSSLHLHLSFVFSLFVITNRAQKPQLSVTRADGFTCTDASVSHLLHLLVLADAGVRHEEVGVVLLAERNLLHRSLVQLGDQLRCGRSARHSARSHPPLQSACVCVCVYSRRCISRYRIVRACSELSSVGSRVATSWANVKASSCFPVL